jgi:hypothetical protein
MQATSRRILLGIFRGQSLLYIEEPEPEIERSYT